MNMKSGEKMLRSTDYKDMIKEDIDKQKQCENLIYLIIIIAVNYFR